MKKFGLTAASSVFFLATGLAMAQQEAATDQMTGEASVARDQPAQGCLDELERVRQQYGQAQLSDSVRNEVQQLSESARILGEAGRAEACDNLVQTISSMTEDDQQRRQEREGLQALRNAPPVTEYEGIVKTSTINGAAIRNMQNEELGTIEETVIDPQSGEISYVVLSVGGFLGVGERLVAVPWEELRIVEAEEEGSASYYVVEASKNYLEQRQPLTGEDWPSELQEQWNPSAQDTGDTRIRE